MRRSRGLGDVYKRQLQYLSTVYLPSVQCPPELALELTKSVQSLEVKPLKRFLDTFIAQSRGA